MFNPALFNQLRRVLAAISPSTSLYFGDDESGILLAYHLKESTRRTKNLETIRALPTDERLDALKVHNKIRARGHGEERVVLGVEWTVRPVKSVLRCADLSPMRFNS